MTADKPMNARFLIPDCGKRTVFDWGYLLSYENNITRKNDHVRK